MPRYVNDDAGVQGKVDKSDMFFFFNWETGQMPSMQDFEKVTL